MTRRERSTPPTARSGTVWNPVDTRSVEAIRPQNPDADTGET